MDYLKAKTIAITNIKENLLSEYNCDFQEISILRHHYFIAKNQDDRNRSKDDFFYMVKFMIEKYSLQQIDKGINTASIAYDVDEMFQFLKDLQGEINEKNID